MDKNTLYIVVPCYNEEAVLPISADVFVQKIRGFVDKGAISPSSRVLFVDDGSKDKTWKIIQDLCENNIECCGVKLSKNCGHQNALMAGMSSAMVHADMIVTIDADLQDDINCIDKMIEKYSEGYEVVYGVRSSRKTDSGFKRWTAQLYYKFLKILGVDIVYNHADFRLLSKRACESLFAFGEVNLFLRGIIRLVGFKNTTVEYERNVRQAGESKYPLKKMLSFAIDGVTSFSIKPVRFISVMGFLSLILTVAYATYTVIGCFMGNTVFGWSSLILSVWFFGSAILISIGVIGEYIGKIYLETKHRPRYFIEDYLNLHDKN